MANITVDPQSFLLVKYDAGEITAIAERIATGVGFAGDHVIDVHVEESTPLTRVLLSSTDPVVIQVEGGAFEDPRRPRCLSPVLTENALARVLFEAHDRLFGGFADAPAPRVTLPQQIAWDVYATGRSERLGLQVQRKPRLYAFRNRHGFTDAADAVFDRLWDATALTWPDIVSACIETGSETPA